MKLKSQKFGTFSFPSEYEVVQVATLNKTDLTGGNNKYYHIEAHASKDGKKFRLYSVWGRVGHHGTKEERIPPQDRESLDKAFESLKKEKTSKRKGYVEIKMASTKVGSDVARQKILSDDIKKDKIEKEDKKNAPKVEIPPGVDRLLDRLYNEAGQAVRHQLSGSLKTTTENPLGTLTLSQIDNGRTILRDIQKVLTDKPKLKGSSDKILIQMSNEFYSAIPQTMSHRPKRSEGKKAMDEWFKKMLLNNAEILDEKEELLDLLSDVQGMIGGFGSSDIVKKYEEVGCKYEPLSPENKKFKDLVKYVNKSRSRHHGWGARVENIWKISVKGQRTKHKPTLDKVGNVAPMFHGSRPANILGICKHGLLMRPPGAYVTGSMFGNGLYFADQSSKSEQYSMVRFGPGPRGRGDSFFMFVADVALGKVKKYTRAQPGLTKPPPGYNSVQGAKGYSLLHDEFIIYNIKQHILQYLLEFRTR